MQFRAACWQPAWPIGALRDPLENGFENCLALLKSLCKEFIGPLTHQLIRLLKNGALSLHIKV